MITDEYDLRTTTLACEDYHMIRGKSNGMFVIPGLINIIKYVWYQISGKEVTMVRSSEWKNTICGNGNADKMMVCQSIQEFIPKTMYKDIQKTYKEFRGKRKDDAGEQDCIDAISLGMHVAIAIIEQNKECDLELE